MMRRISLVVLMLLLACSFAFADDYIRIDVDSIVKGTAGADLDFYIIRQCPDPVNISGASNGWQMTATNCTWTFNGFTPGASGTAWWTLGLGFGFSDGLTSTTASGWFGCGGAGSMPVVPNEVLYFTLNFDISDDEGTICIDSAWFPPAGSWKFSGMTCGQGGAPDRPLFLAKDGSDAVHPICITVYEAQCTPPTGMNGPAGDELTGNHCSPLTHGFTVDNPGDFDGVPALPLVWTVTTGPGAFTGATYDVGPMATGTYPVTIRVTNDCGEFLDYGFDLVYENTVPTFDNCAGMPPAIGMGNNYYYDFDATDPDFCDALTYVMPIVITPTPFNDPQIDGTGVLTWMTHEDDGGITFTITITVNDGEGGTADCVFDVEVLESEPFEIQLEKVEHQYQGHYANVSIFLNKGSEFFGGFDFLVAYDASGLTFMGATLGTFLDGCWEYFTYRYGWQGNCEGPCPSGLLRVVGIADINNGPYHPDVVCLRKTSTPYDITTGLGVQEELVNLTFYVTNDRTYDCMYLPIRFFWHDCGDNSISNLGGDTLWISRYVYDYDWSLGFMDITGMIHYGGHWWLFGPPYPFVDFELNTACMNDDPEKPSPIRFIDFITGGVDIECADSIDLRGDINLNSIANEIADAVLYTNYFIYGLSVFDIMMEGQIAASDVNNDGKVLTVGDLVYLIRIVVGDALPFPKLSPFANSVEVVSGDVVVSKSNSDIGAALFVFDGAGDATLLADGMKIKSDVVDGQLRVLVWSDNTNRIPAGTNDLIAVSGDISLIETSFSDYNGNLMNVGVAKIAPSLFTLKQNYPNPFNPTTDITIVMPEEGNWKLNIYNVAGQLVESFSGYDIGEVTVTWDATGVASGIYFYKATAGQYTDTKKMVLMK